MRTDSNTDYSRALAAWNHPADCECGECRVLEQIKSPLLHGREKLDAEAQADRVIADRAAAVRKMRTINGEHNDLCCETKGRKSLRAPRLLPEDIDWTVDPWAVDPYTCKGCRKKADRFPCPACAAENLIDQELARIAFVRRYKLGASMWHKACTGCGKRKHLKRYYRKQGTPDGMETMCIECVKSRPAEAAKRRHKGR